MTNGSDSPERDPGLDRAWRAHSSESPPAELDRAILAAAHRAVGSGPQVVAPSAEATRPQRWWMPLAAAATIGAVAIGILQMTPRDQDALTLTEPVVTEKRAPAKEKIAAAPAVSRAADGSTAERDAPAPAPAPAPAGLNQFSEITKSKQEVAAPASPIPAAAPPAATPAPAAPPVATPPSALQRAAPEVAGKLAARLPEPFPAADVPSKTDMLDKKNAVPAEAARTEMTAADTMAPAARPAPPPVPPPVTAEERTASRKDAAERQGGGAAVPAAAPAPPAARAAAKDENATASFAAAPIAQGEPARTRDAGGGRGEARLQAAPSTQAQPEPATKATAPEDLRAKARDPDAWITRIRKLREEGNSAEALRELRDFRDVVPDADKRLPADLLAWANTFRP